MGCKSSRSDAELPVDAVDLDLRIRAACRARDKPAKSFMVYRGATDEFW